VSLAAIAPGANIAAEDVDCPEYVDVRREYASIASRTTAFNSRSSVPSEWGYSKDFVASVLGGKDTVDHNAQAIADLLMVACGGGCPLAQLPPETSLEGACVLDLGCGGGHDLALAARAVGRTGRVFGMDLTPQMLERAEAVVSAVTDCTVASCPVELICAPVDQCGEMSRPIEHAEVADLVISNGVFNLCPDKQGLSRRESVRSDQFYATFILSFLILCCMMHAGAFDTAYHWCKPGGLIVFADVVLEDSEETPSLAGTANQSMPATVGDSYTSSGWSN
jgi:SAM-dependent methyltransferase